MNYNEVAKALKGKNTVNAYINGNERVRIVGLTEKMVRINIYNGASLVKNPQDNYVVKNVRPESISFTKEKVSKSNNKPRGVFQVVKNETLVKEGLEWEAARELYKKEAAKGVEGETYAVYKLVDGVRAEKASISKTIKKKASKARANTYVVRVEGTDVSELGNFADTLSAYKTKVTELETAEEFGTVVTMIKIGKENVESTSREITITEPVVEEVKEEVKATEPVASTETENEEKTDEAVAA